MGGRISRRRRKKKQERKSQNFTSTDDDFSLHIFFFFKSQKYRKKRQKILFAIMIYIISCNFFVAFSQFMIYPFDCHKFMFEALCLFRGYKKQKQKKTITRGC